MCVVSKDLIQLKNYVHTGLYSWNTNVKSSLQHHSTLGVWVLPAVNKQEEPLITIRQCSQTIKCLAHRAPYDLGMKCLSWLNVSICCWKAPSGGPFNSGQQSSFSANKCWWLFNAVVFWSDGITATGYLFIYTGFAIGVQTILQFNSVVFSVV